MHFKLLTKIGTAYLNEEGKSGHRVAAFDALAADLRRHMLDAASGNVRAAAKAKRRRRMLTLEGAVVSASGHVDWSQSTRTVEYDRSFEKRGMTKVYFAGATLRTLDARHNFVNLDTANMVTHFSGPGKAIFVMSGEGNIHVSSHSVGYRHHSSLLAGADVAGAGELQVDNGNLVWLSNKSGHYRPSVHHMLQVLHQIQKKGLPMTFRLQVHTATEKTDYPDVATFLDAWELAGEPDFEETKLMAYMEHLTPAVLAPNGWRWRDKIAEKAGIYTIANGTFVPHRTVRRWLKSQGLYATNAVQSGAGR